MNAIVEHDGNSYSSKDIEYLYRTQIVFRRPRPKTRKVCEESGLRKGTRTVLFSILPKSRAELEANRLLWCSSQSGGLDNVESSYPGSSAVAFALPLTLFRFLSSVTFSELLDVQAYTLALLADEHDDGLLVLEKELVPDLVARVRSFVGSDRPLPGFGPYVDFVLDHVSSTGSWQIDAIVACERLESMDESFKELIDVEAHICTDREQLLFRLQDEFEGFTILLCPYLRVDEATGVFLRLIVRRLISSALICARTFLQLIECGVLTGGRPLQESYDVVVDRIIPRLLLEMADVSSGIESSQHFAQSRRSEIDSFLDAEDEVLSWKSESEATLPNNALASESRPPTGDGNGRLSLKLLLLERPVTRRRYVEACDVMDAANAEVY